jgi:hypothetical protein
MLTGALCRGGDTSVASSLAVAVEVSIDLPQLLRDQTPLFRLVRFVAAICELTPMTVSRWLSSTKSPGAKPTSSVAEFREDPLVSELHFHRHRRRRIPAWRTRVAALPRTYR